VALKMRGAKVWPQLRSLSARRLSIEAEADITSLGDGWFDSTQTSSLIRLVSPQRINPGWALLQITLARSGQPVRLFARTDEHAGGSPEALWPLRMTGGRRGQGLIFLPAARRHVLVRIDGGPTQMQIKKASVRELGHLPLLGKGAVRDVVGAVLSRLRGGFASEPPAEGTPRQPATGDSPGTYREWVRRFDTLSPEDADACAALVERLATRPLISVVMPVFDPEVRWLRAAIESVRQQLYPRWQLCIADDASTDPEVHAALHEYASLDPRIRVTFRQENGGIAAASNTALRLADGDFVAFLDHDDRLPAHALALVAAELSDHPDADIIYSDEDKIAADGRRYDPYFKPDWNYALLLSQNYVNHLSVLRRVLVEAAGGFRIGFDGAQDHELLLRCVERTSAARIRHIPHVLYHWRATAASTARSIEAKPHAWDAGRRAIAGHLQRRGITGTAQRVCGCFYQVDYPLPSPPPRVSVLIPTTARLSLLQPCLVSLLRQTDYPDFEIVLALKRSDSLIAERRDFLASAAQEAPVRTLVYADRPFNFAWVNNWMAAQATGGVLVFLNDDVEVVTSDWLRKLVARVALEGVGAVGALLQYPDETIQHAGVVLGPGGVAAHAFRHAPHGGPSYFGRAALEQEYAAVTAGCMAIRRDVFQEAGGFDERLAIAFNDVDLCLRLRRAGLRILWTPSVTLRHRESASLGAHDAGRSFEFAREVHLMREQWGMPLDRDPHYNPNLSLDPDALFRLARPPRVLKPWRTPGTEQDIAAGLRAVDSQRVQPPRADRLS
jgi:GT2 family glycosyltransferase